MKMVLDSFEIKAARQLFDELLEPVPDKAPKPPSPPALQPERETRPMEPAPPVYTADDGSAGLAEEGTVFKGDLLEEALVAMCKRGGFLGAVVADVNGLPLTAFNSPVTVEALAAFTTVLGDALAKSGQLLDEPNADNITVYINYTDKAVLRRFMVCDNQYFLMIIAPQEVDERSEVEASITQLTSILEPKK